MGLVKSKIARASDTLGGDKGSVKWRRGAPQKAQGSPSYWRAQWPCLYRPTYAL